MSANHEAWAFGVSDGEGAGLLSGLRDYIAALASSLPLSASIEDAVDIAFDVRQGWVSGLPPAAGLLGSPSATSLLERIAAFAGEPVESVSVLAPYFDDDGAALSAIRRLFRAPVTVWMQPGHEGLSRAAAAALPEGIDLRSIDCRPEQRPSFVHAKVLALHLPDRTVLAIGSANCSRAALLADGSWGNAELMAVDTVSRESFEGLMGELVVSETPPVLPEAPPSDDWEPDSAPLRVLAARQEGGRIDVAFRAAETVAGLSVSSDEGVWPATSLDSERETAIFSVPLRLRSLSLSGTTASGTRVESEPAWVDDEASLAAVASLRRVVRRLEDLESGRDGGVDAFRAVLDQFRDYLRDPEVSLRRLRVAAGPETIGNYDPASVFSEEFGRAGGPHHSMEPGQNDILSIIAALFSIGGGSRGPARPAGESEESEEDADPAAEEKRLVAARKPDPDGRAAARLRRAVDGVAATLVEPAFITARQPQLLSDDIALTGILLTKGRTDGHLDAETCRATTRSLWSALFFGPHGGDGTVAHHLFSLDAGARQSFVAEFATPRLAAALILWSLPEWGAGDAQSAWFRVSAAQLQYRHSWLFEAAPPETVIAALRALGAGLLPDETDAAIAAWTRLVRSGEALRLLSDKLNEIPTADLLREVTSATVSPRDLLWQAKAFALPMDSYRRDRSVSAEVLLIGEAGPKKFKGNFLLPVRDLLDREIIHLPPLAEAEIRHFLSHADLLRPT